MLQPILRIQALDLLVEFNQRGLCVADDLNVRANHFVHLRGIDIHMDDLGVSSKLVGLPYDTVVKSRANVENKVRFNDRLISVSRSVHSQHP